MSKRLLLIAPLVLGACAHEEPPPPRTASAQVMPLPERNTEGEIAEVLDVANRGEIEQGLIAMKVSTSPEVRAFAQAMIGAHANADRQQHEVLGLRHIVPVESQLSRTVQLNIKNNIARLQSMEGAEFDRAYVDAQLAQHRQLLGLIDAQFLPDARDTSYRAFLTQLRENVSTHVAHAERVETQLAA